MMKKSLVTTAVVLGLSACAANQTSVSSVAAQHYDLNFGKQSGQAQSAEINGKTIQYRAYEGIVYVQNPVDTRYQSMNVYVPEAYYQNGSINGFTADNAPIFFPNQVGGYMPGEPGKPELDKRQNNQPNSILTALSKGYVVASPGARGRTSANGKAPAAIVDLKAAVRYLKANDRAMPGDANKIISNGTSAGGALSALLGASGNASEYQPYLKALGAADAGDDIFAVSAYCPITNLENANAAYEWQFNGINDYQKMNITQLDYHVERKLVPGTLTDAQIKLSGQLKPLFSTYINSLHLKDSSGKTLQLDKQGNGSFKDLVNHYIMQSAQTQLDQGKTLTDRKWLTVKNGKAVAMNFAAYAKAAGRQKTPPAFDAVDLSSGENQLFGTETVDKQHFTAFSQANSTVQNATRVDEKIVNMMNPMHYIGRAQSPQNWRIRQGTNDRDTSLAIPVILATKLQNEGKTVDFALPWDQAHGGDYDLEALFDWMKQVSTQK
ncbi:MAG: subtype B tannase [Neisseria sp.]|uniref:subtype B tannase n=1 Tax=Neisseria sp. TaxID=192066 RepID=UPI0026DC775A|nr:subtype B tannase [Neisseria sp.]MDO4641755.1 subtype B tannase [Neisseria sp.]